VSPRQDAPGSPSGVYPHNLFPEAANAHERRDNIDGQPLVTRQELAFYTIRTPIDALF
jgi:hypothetical protein